jgi:hypothetical protein
MTQIFQSPIAPIIMASWRQLRRPRSCAHALGRSRRVVPSLQPTRRIHRGRSCGAALAGSGSRLSWRVDAKEPGTWTRTARRCPRPKNPKRAAFFVNRQFAYGMAGIPSAKQGIYLSTDAEQASLSLRGSKRGPTRSSLCQLYSTIPKNSRGKSIESANSLKIWGTFWYACCSQCAVVLGGLYANAERRAFRRYGSD